MLKRIENFTKHMENFTKHMENFTTHMENFTTKSSNVWKTLLHIENFTTQIDKRMENFTTKSSNVWNTLLHIENFTTHNIWKTLLPNAQTRTLVHIWKTLLHIWKNLQPNGHIAFRKIANIAIRKYCESQILRNANAQTHRKLY
jgi:hypothetical protein